MDVKELLDEKAVSKAQQRFFGLVHRCKKEGICPSKEVKKAAKSISGEEAKKFAKTKHKGLPERVKEGTSFKEFLILEATLTVDKLLKLGGYSPDQKEDPGSTESSLTKVRKLEQVLKGAKVPSIKTDTRRKYEVGNVVISFGIKDNKPTSWKMEK